MFDPFVILSGAGVGFVVGLTGMGGGALMTPILVLLFGIEPLTAVSSDIVASMVMKPIGGARPLEARDRAQAAGQMADDRVDPDRVPRRAAAAQARLGRRRCKAGVKTGARRGAAGRRHRRWSSSRCWARGGAPRRQPHPVRGETACPTLLIGIVGGLIVGITSVGSGSLIIIMLMMLYPRHEAVRAGRHRPGAGGAAGRQRGARPPAVRQLQAGPHRVDPDRQRPGRLHRRALLVARARLPDPAGADGGAAAVGAEAGGRAQQDARGGRADRDRRRHRLHAVGLAPRQADARCARRQRRAVPRRCRWESPRRRLRPPAPIAATSDEPPQRVAARAAIHRHETGLSSAWNAVVVAPGRVLVGDDQRHASG